MERIEKTFEIDVPVRVAYNQWTQFEEFPRFMDGVKQVKQLDNVHLHWRVEIAGQEKEWNAQITEQVPDQVIAWRTLSGTPNAGRVRFAKLGEDRTQITLTLEYEPEGFVEQVGDLFGVLSRKVEKAVDDFKALIEERRHETGGWRGEVRGGRTAESGASASPGPAQSDLVGSRSDATAGGDRLDSPSTAAGGKSRR